jgi:hypothetical protein
MPGREVDGPGIGVEGGQDKTGYCIVVALTEYEMIMVRYQTAYHDLDTIFWNVLSDEGQAIAVIDGLSETVLFVRASVIMDVIGFSVPRIS